MNETVSASENQLRAAVDTEHVAVTPRGGVVALTAHAGRNLRVDDATALRTVTDRRVGAPMIHVVAGIGAPWSFHQMPRFLALAASRCRHASLVNMMGTCDVCRIRRLVMTCASR